MAEWEEKGQTGVRERVLTVRVREDLESKLKTLAETRGIPASEAMREAMTLWVTTEQSALVTRGAASLVRLSGVLGAGVAFGRRVRLVPGRDKGTAEGRALREELDSNLRSLEEDLRRSERESASLRKKISALEDKVQELHMLKERLKREEESRRRLLAEQEAVGQQLARLSAMLIRVEEEADGAGEEGASE